jgi:hypothetical protein
VTPFNLQWSFPNGTYFVNPNRTGYPFCYYRPDYNYAPSFKGNYSTATQRSVSIPLLGNIGAYVGAVKDPGTCNTTVGVDVTKRTDYYFGSGFRSTLVQYAADFYLNAAPGGCVAEKLDATFTYTAQSFGTPAASLFQLPPLCLNSPIDYCSAYYGCDVVTPVNQ